MANKRTGLSKSRLMSYRQCKKKLYLETHYRELAEYGDDTLQAFATGHQVGDLSRELFGEGPYISPENNLKQALQETDELLKRNIDQTLYEATVQHRGLLIRADVLKQSGNALDLIEVKASTALKEDVHLPDCAVQAWVFDQIGKPLRSVSLAHINNQFVYKTKGHYEGLLSVVDVTEAIQPLKQQVDSWVGDALQVINGEMPEIGIGSHCHKPYPCPFLGHCSPEPTDYPISALGSNTVAVRNLTAQGIEDIRDVPFDALSTDNQVRIWKATLEDVPFVDPEALGVLKSLDYPRYYLDFETISFAVPIWLGTRPYQQLPFQWSCHIEPAPDKLEHLEFLADTPESPMRAVAESMLKALGPEGPILVYSSFEASRIRELAEQYPDLREPLLALLPRLVDLLPIVKAGFYHRDMQGSRSIKAVLPVLAPDLSYQALGEIQHGGAAAAGFGALLNPETPDDRRSQLRSDLLEYCKLDTLAMVRVKDALLSYC